jgi:hypothetical protein
MKKCVISNVVLKRLEGGVKPYLNDQRAEYLTKT